MRQIPSQFNNDISNPKNGTTVKWMLWKGVSFPFIFKDKQENQESGVSQKLFFFNYFLLVLFFNQEFRLYDLLSSLKFPCFFDPKAHLNSVWKIKRQSFTLRTE